MPTPRAEPGVASINGLVYAVGGYTTMPLNTLEVYDPATGSWTTKASMPTPRNSPAVAAINGKLYVVGDDTGSLDVYDPALNMWDTKASLPMPVIGPSGTAINGKFYVAGGTAPGCCARVNYLQVYDPVLDSWEVRAPMPTARTTAAAAEINGKLYVVGGSTNGPDTNALEMYDPALNLWVTKTNAPTAREYLSAANINGRLYAIGGHFGGCVGCHTGVNEVYDPAVDAWMSDAAMPTVRAGMGMAVSNDVAYLVGGYASGDSHLLDVVEVFIPVPSTTGWSTVTPAMPTPRAEPGVASINGLVYVVGGYTTMPLNTLEVYDPVTGSWTTKASMPTPRNSPAVAAINGRLYVVGDDTGSLDVYDPALNMWETKASLPMPVIGSAGAAINGKFYVAGGNDPGCCNRVGYLQVYDPVMNTWDVKAPMPTGRATAAAAEMNGKLYVVGGSTNGGADTQALEMYDPALNSWVTKTDAPTAREYLSAASMNGRLYVIGGHFAGCSGCHTDANDVYNPAADSWTSDAPMPTVRAGMGLGVNNGTAYVAGGYASGDSHLLDVVETFIPLPVAVFNTGAGPNIVVNPANATTGATPVVLTFASVVRPGTTSLSTSGGGQAPPSGFVVGTPPIYYDIATGATFDGAISVCIDYGAQSFGASSDLRLMHLESGSWVDRTVSIDLANHIACGNVTSLSPFAVFAHLTGLTALAPAHAWLGLKNSDDVGTKFDLRAEVLKNGVVVGSGEALGLAGGSSGFNNAVDRMINLTLPQVVSMGSGDTLGIRLSVRIAANSSHRSGTARLWFNDSAADSRFGATLGSQGDDYYLIKTISPATLALKKNALGSGPKTTVDVSVDRAVGGNPFKPFGTWSLTLP